MYTGGFILEAWRTKALQLNPDIGVEWSEYGYKIHKTQSLGVWTVISVGLKGHAAIEITIHGKLSHDGNWRTWDFF